MHRGAYAPYNADGIRTSKNVNGVEHRYYLIGSLILAETWTDGNDVTHLLTYLYDQNGAPIGLKYRNNAYGTGTFVSYFFEKNLQGDIVAVYNEFGEQLGVYVYDAWEAFKNGKY